MKLRYLCARFLLVGGLALSSGYAPDVLAAQITGIGAPAEIVIFPELPHHDDNDVPGWIGGPPYTADGLNDVEIGVTLTSSTAPVRVPITVSDSAGTVEYWMKVEIDADPAEILTQAQGGQLAIAIEGDGLPDGLAFDYDAPLFAPRLFNGNPQIQTDRLMVWDSLQGDEVYGGFTNVRVSLSLDVANTVENTGGYTFDLIFTPTLTPEPGTAGMFAVLAGALACRRTRRRA